MTNWTQNYICNAVDLDICMRYLVSWIKRDQIDVTSLLFHYLLLKMFRMLIQPSSGVCDLFDELFHGLYCSNESNTTHEITHQISRKLLRMDILTSEACWALNNEIIKQVTSSWSLFIQHYWHFHKTLLEVVSWEMVRWAVHVAEMLEKRNAYGILVEKQKKWSSRPRCIWSDNTTGLGEVGCKVAGSMRLAQDSAQWWAVVIAVMNLRFP